VKFENGDEVIQDGRFVTVRIGDLKACRQYTDVWNATRAVERLKVGPSARKKFFNRLPVASR